MRWIKGLCLFGVSFSIVFGVTVYANAQTQSEVLEQAQGAAQETASVWWAAAERFRLAAAERFNTKLAAAQAARQAKEDALHKEANESLDDLLVAQPRPVSEQLKDTSGILEGMEVQAYRVASFMFGTAIVFYGVIILFVLWCIRMFWRRVRRA